MVVPRLVPVSFFQVPGRCLVPPSPPRVSVVLSPPSIASSPCCPAVLPSVRLCCLAALSSVSLCCPAALSSVRICVPSHFRSVLLVCPPSGSFQFLSCSFPLILFLFLF